MLPDVQDPKCIRGYYTLSACSVKLTDLPEAVQKKLPRYEDMPAALLGRLAVDLKLKGEHLGEHLLLDAMQKVLTNSATVGTLALIVDAKDQGLAAYYQDHGFIPFPSQPLRLFLPVATIAQILR